MCTEEDYEEEELSYGCSYCGDPDVPLNLSSDLSLCEHCEEIERTFDIDGYEQEKRERIAEANEF